jgi:hypothetical protein
MSQGVLSPTGRLPGPGDAARPSRAAMEPRPYWLGFLLAGSVVGLMALSWGLRIVLRMVL